MNVKHRLAILFWVKILKLYTVKFLSCRSYQVL